ncbi:MAG: hypothetical protein GKR92_07350 [Gammaproteobacteria bacterium]|nr:MAG: hypothetical protein GKR92_07350 [Gammaproteobacteria bacterium]
MSVLETIIGKRKPNFDSYNLILDLLQKFMIESKSQASIRDVTPPQQAVMTMYTYGALAYFAEVHEVPEQELILVLDSYLQRQGLSDKQSVMEARIIVEQAKDPAMQWGIETGYNSSMYWYKDKNSDAPKALARLLKTTR